MKTKYSILAVCFLVAGIARADDSNAPAATATPAAPPQRQREPGAGRGQIAGREIEVLTPEQRTSWRSVMTGQREKLHELEGKLMAARKDLFDVTISSTFDEAQVRAKAKAVADLQVEMNVLRAKAYSQIQPPLSEEQVQKLKSFEGSGGPAAGVAGPSRLRQRAAPAPGADENGLPPKQ